MPVASNESQRLDLKIVQGKTFRRVIRWEIEPLVSKPITGITKAAPAKVTAVAHDMPDGWRAAVASAGGMRQINAGNYPPKDPDFHRCTIVDVDHVSMDDVNSADFSDYTGGGFLVYYTPASLAACTALLVIRDKPGGTEYVRLTDADGVVLDDTTKTIEITLEADDTEAYTFTRGVWELEIRDASDVVTGLFHGSVSVVAEVAT